MRSELADSCESVGSLNALAAACCHEMLTRTARLRVGVHELPRGIVIDCGVELPGGLEAGLFLARLCLADLGQVNLLPANSPSANSGQVVSVITDHPVEACLRSQYAGWPLQAGKFFAMASGPMRAVRGREAVLEELGGPESASEVVGVLETSELPDASVLDEILAQCPGATRAIVAVAPTTSLAGTLQVVGRSVETAMHKLHACGFDPRRVRCGTGTAPLPPPANSTVAAIGRTNDAILYGAQVTLWIDANGEELALLGPQLPSLSSHDYGQPFEQIFRKYGCDFYRLDPALFSPAEVELVSLRDGSSQRFGRMRPDILQQSFATATGP
jgi:methenyltetrahydromethanopterin cyclohydrolase